MNGIKTEAVVPAHPGYNVSVIENEVYNGSVIENYFLNCAILFPSIKVIVDGVRQNKEPLNLAKFSHFAEKKSFFGQV